MIRIPLIIAALALAAVFPCGAEAHSRSQSFSTWTVTDTRVRVTFSVEAREVTRLPPLEAPIADLAGLLAAHLSTRVAVLADGIPCATLGGPRALAAQPGYSVVELQFGRPRGASLELVNNAFFDVAPSHVHYARIALGSGAPVEHLLSNTARRVTLASAAGSADTPRGTGFLAFVALGIRHIFGGVDHVAFLLTLLLLCSRPSEVLLMVTGFTLGHSVTLGLAVTGLVQPIAPVIEALIAFTIAIVAVENIAVSSRAGRLRGLLGAVVLLPLAVVSMGATVRLPWETVFGLALFSLGYLHLNDTRERAVRVRPLMTVVFGLIHGFGFASVLITLHLPGERMLLCLLGFNLGVEAGQVMIVAAFWAVGSAVRMRLNPRRRSLAMELASAALCAFGVFWFVGRSAG